MAMEAPSSMITTGDKLTTELDQDIERVLGVNRNGENFTDLSSGIPEFTGSPQDMLYYFQLQMQVARETLFFNSISNITKARQDAAMNAVRNVKN